jgi:hypothetical protein
MLEAKTVCRKCQQAMHGQKTCPRCGFFDIARQGGSSCQRCGGVFRGDGCIQCGWTGERITEASKVEAKRRDDILDAKRLRNLQEKFLKDGVKKRLRDYVYAWLARNNRRYPDYDEEATGYPNDIYEAIDYAFEKAESLKKRPDDFFGFFRARAWERFDALIATNLSSPDAQLSDGECLALDLYL